MGRRISTEPGVNTAPASETSVRSSGSVKMTQQNFIWMFVYLFVFCQIHQSNLDFCCFRKRSSLQPDQCQLYESESGYAIWK